MARKARASANIVSLLEENHLLSAVDILTKLQQQGLSLNKTTIYRALDRLLEEGKICRHALGQDVLLYELKEHSHNHLVCENCGEIRSLHNTSENSETIDDFTVTHEHRTIFGVCKQCSNNDASIQLK